MPERIAHLEQEVRECRKAQEKILLELGDFREETARRIGDIREVLAKLQTRATLLDKSRQMWVAAVTGGAVSLMVALVTAFAVG